MAMVTGGPGNKGRPAGGNMEIKGTAIQTLHQSSVTEDCVSERRLWTAVVAHALEDWQRGTLRERRKAQQFIFEDHEDFERACFNAGLDRESLRSRLLKIGQKVEMVSTWNQHVAA